MKGTRKKYDAKFKAKVALEAIKQCTILGLNRTSIYYSPKGESKENLELA